MAKKKKEDKSRTLDGVVGEFTSNQTFGIEDGVFGVHGDLVLGGVTDETFGVSEGNVRRSGSVSHIIRNNFDGVVFPASYTGVGGTEINSDRNWLFFACHSDAVGWWRGWM